MVSAASAVSPHSSTASKRTLYNGCGCSPRPCAFVSREDVGAVQAIDDAPPSLVRSVASAYVHVDSCGGSARRHPGQSAGAQFPHACTDHQDPRRLVASPALVP